MNTIRRLNLNKLFVGLILVFGMLYLASPPIADAAIPKYINFQGRLTDPDGSPVSNGTYTVTFRLYSAETGGDALWTEEQSVTVSSGVFNTALGTVTSLGDLAFDTQYWLSVQVSGDTEMTPRQRLAAAIYALNADSVDALTSSQFLRSDADDIASGQITLSYPGSALTIQPSSAPLSGTNIVDIKDTSGISIAGIDDDGDLVGGNLYLQGHSDSIIYFGPKDAPVASITIDEETGEMTFSDDAIFSGTVGLPNGSVGAAELASNAVTQAKVADDAIGTDELANDVVVNTTGAISGASVTASTGGIIATDGDLEADNLVLRGSSDPTITFLQSDGITVASTIIIDQTTGEMTFSDDLVFQGATTIEQQVAVTGDLTVSGDIGIGTPSPDAKLHVNGNVKIETMPTFIGGSNIKWDPDTKGLGLDIAELFETTEEVEVGDVLVIDETEDIKLRKSNSPYEKGVCGIASGSPAILFEGSSLEIAPTPGGFTKGKKPPVALAGRISCKVSTENGPIERGDLLTSSSTPGHAMKATDREKSFGAILGKALEPFDPGAEGEETGKIIVLVTLQ